MFLKMNKGVTEYNHISRYNQFFIMVFLTHGKN